MLVKWPSKIPAGKVVRSPVITNDLFETLQSLRHSSTIERTDSDGIDLINLLEEETKAERALYWHYPHYGNQGGFPGAVIRKGNWKLIQNFDTGQVELYNLYKDIGEQNNRSSDLPKICSELLVDLEAWKSKVKAKPTTPNPNSKY
jgi:arylsulfatase A-like enzyme